MEQITEWLTAHQLLVFSILVPILSALVAAVSSWYSTKRTLRSEQTKMTFQSTLKISDFRQQWINDLRDAMSEFQSYGVLPDSDPKLERDFYRLGTKIELLMNPSDADYKRLSDCLYGFLAAADGDIRHKYSQNPEFITLCQGILKREWERLKSDLEKNAQFG